MSNGQVTLQSIKAGEAVVIGDKLVACYGFTPNGRPSSTGKNNLHQVGSNVAYAPHNGPGGPIKASVQLTTPIV